MNDFKVTPWEVSGDIDYDELIVRFGTKKVDDELMERMASYGPVHLLLRRGIVYSQRDMEWLLNEYDKGNKFFLYTGRGPSGQIHLGHLMPWVFTKYVQDTFGANLYFQLTDDEKFLFNDNLQLADTKRLAYENALDVIALGFDQKRTKFVLDTECIDILYPMALEVSRRITFSTVKAVFGFEASNNIGEIFYTSVQAAPCFMEKILYDRPTPCLIPCGIDQDPHFRITRDVAPMMGLPKPALLHTKMFPGLTGGDKMSSSVPGSTIYTTDTPKEVKKKIGNAFTGGAVTVEEQRKNGGKPEVCAVYKYNFFLFEENDQVVAEMADRCRKGEILCGECKKLLTEKIVKFLEGHQERRERAKDQIHDFMLHETL